MPKKKRSRQNKSSDHKPVVEDASFNSEASVEERVITLPKKRYSYLILSIIVVIITIIISGFFFWKAASQPVPRAIQRQVSYGIFYPTDRTRYPVNKKSFRYDNQTKVLSYSLRSGSTTIAINQQATPESFTDIPQAYDKLISSLQAYASIDTVNGKLALTMPTEFKGAQSAVLNAKGTLLFARPSTNLSTDDWRQLFNNLRLLTY